MHAVQTFTAQNALHILYKEQYGICVSILMAAAPTTVMREPNRRRLGMDVRVQDSQASTVKRLRYCVDNEWRESRHRKIHAGDEPLDRPADRRGALLHAGRGRRRCRGCRGGLPGLARHADPDPHPAHVPLQATAGCASRRADRTCRHRERQVLERGQGRRAQGHRSGRMRLCQPLSDAGRHHDERGQRL